MKRLFFDIETSLSVVATFSLWPKSIPHTGILKEWHIICAAWKWEGEKKVYIKKTYDSDDKQIVQALREAIIRADEIVYHNGKKFDFKKLQTRAIANGVRPIPKPRETDTLIQSRKHFGFTSNRLDYIGHYLKCVGKIETSPNLWMNALKGQKKAINEMAKYNKRDVTLLEEVFQKMKPYIDPGYNMNTAQELGDKCHKCGSENLIVHGWRYTATNKYRRYNCKDCGAWPSSGTREKIKFPVNR